MSALSDLDNMVPLYSLLMNESIRLGKRLGLTREVIWEVYRLARRVLEEVLPRSDPRDIVKACYYIVLKRSNLLTGERINALNNPSVNWRILVPLIENRF